MQNDKDLSVLEFFRLQALDIAGFRYHLDTGGWVFTHDGDFILYFW